MSGSDQIKEREHDKESHHDHIRKQVVQVLCPNQSILRHRHGLIIRPYHFPFVVRGKDFHKNREFHDADKQNHTDETVEKRVIHLPGVQRFLYFKRFLEIPRVTARKRDTNRQETEKDCDEGKKQFLSVRADVLFIQKSFHLRHPSLPSGRTASQKIAYCEDRKRAQEHPVPFILNKTDHAVEQFEQVCVLQFLRG